MKGCRFFHSNNDSALTSKPNLNVARQLDSSDTRFPMWIFYFSLFALIALLILLLFSCYERVKLKKGKFAKIKGRKLRKRG